MRPGPVVPVPAKEVLAFGAVGAVPSGLGVVDGNDLPYLPEALKKKEPLLWGAGSGVDVWKLFCACITGDLKIIKRLLKKDPSLVRAG